MRGILEDIKLLLILISLSLIFFLFDTLKILDFPKSVIQNLTIPIQYGLYESGSYFKNQFNSLITLRKTARENQALQKQLAEVLLENAALRKKMTEENILGEQYQKMSTQAFDLLPAKVIALGRYLTIDRGDQDGVKVGQAVVFKDHFVGEVKVVTPKSSQVILPQDSDFKITVFSQGSSGRAKGVLYGQFNSELLMDKILHQEEVVVGDLVYSEGTEGRLPRGLVMGKVAEVFIRENELFKQAKVNLIIKPTDLDIVFVIRST